VQLNAFRVCNYRTAPTHDNVQANTVKGVDGRPRLTNSMEQSPSWKANSHTSSQEISCLLQNSEVRYGVHKSLSSPRPCV